jgi:hypothetical protein
METLDLTWGRFLRFWWAVFWKGVVGLLPLVIPLVVLEAREPIFYHRWYAALNLSISALAMAVWAGAMWLALRKTYSDFRIVLVPRDFKL